MPTAKTFRFGPFFDYWESEISVLVRNSINPAYVYLALEHLCDIVLGAIAYRIAEPATRSLPPQLVHGADRLCVDAQLHEVRIGARRLERRLSAQEFELLRYLYEHHERVCSRRELGDMIWGDGNWDPNMLHRLVHRLKAKVEPRPETPCYVQTVPQIGYRLTV